MGYVVGRCVNWYYLQEVKSSFSFSYAKPHTFFPTDWRKSKEHWWQPRRGHMSGGKGRECGAHRHGNQGDGQDPPHVPGQRQRLHPSPRPCSCAGLQTQRWPQKVGGAAVALVSPHPPALRLSPSGSTKCHYRTQEISTYLRSCHIFFRCWKKMGEYNSNVAKRQLGKLM